MNRIQTAISIEKPLYERITALVEDLQVSTLDLLTIAIDEYVQRHSDAGSEKPRPRFGSARG